MAATKSKSQNDAIKIPYELYDLIKAAISYGRDYWDSYSGDDDDVTSGFLQDEQACLKIDGVMEHYDKEPDFSEIQVPK